LKTPEQNTQVPVPAALVEVRRGPLVESRHRGHVAAVDGEGRPVASLGEPDTVTYLRSSAKPFQAVPLVTSGAAAAFGLTDAELAVACGSHSGEDLHARVVAGMLEKAGLDESLLKCGVHDPFDRATTERLRRESQSPGVLRNNCSGKHTGMLILSRHLGAPPETYDDPEGPVQRAILRAVSQFSGVPEAGIDLGTDGCGVPVFGVSVSTMALMYARLVAPPPGFDEATRVAARGSSRP
jgi:L-asparaginase II